MNDITQKLLDQATALARTVGENLSSDCDLSLDMTQKIDGAVEKCVQGYVSECIEQQDIDNKVEEAIEDIDFDAKVQDVLDNSCTIVDEDKATELAHEAISETDWYQIISDNDIATENYVDEIVNERVEAWVDEKLFGALKDIVLKCFERSAKTWMDDIRQQGVDLHLELKKKEEEQDKEESTETEAKEEVTV
tara:strand:- start:439 stop:1017 length:579 start_codon:yes stop_codon:yes gene_type:complete